MSVVSLLITGLLASVMVLSLSIVFAVFSEWGFAYFHGVTSVQQIKRDNFWWRSSWTLLAGGLFMVSLTRLPFTGETLGRSYEWALIVQLLGWILLNLGLVLARAGFSISAGSPKKVLLFILSVPAGFTVISIWGKL